MPSPSMPGAGGVRPEGRVFLSMLAAGLPGFLFSAIPFVVFLALCAARIGREHVFKTEQCDESQLHVHFPLSSKSNLNPVAKSTGPINI